MAGSQGSLVTKQAKSAGATTVYAAWQDFLRNTYDERRVQQRMLRLYIHVSTRAKLC
jgi:hypothetical protein